MKLIALFTVIALVLPVAAEPKVAVYDFDRPISESGTTMPTLLQIDLEATLPLTFLDVARSLASAASDEEVRAIVLDPEGSGLDLTQIQEVRRHLLAAREAGKDVWVYSDTLDLGTALIGSAANHFVLMPEASVDFSGINAESLYLKGLMDRAGVKADVIHIGDFKSFGEMFYRSGPSEPAAAQQEKLVDGLFEQIISAVADGRAISREKVLAMINAGGFTATEAKDAGLVDELAHRTDFNRSLRQQYGDDADFDHDYQLPDRDGPEIDGFFDLVKLILSNGKSVDEHQDYVAVVVMEGAISDASISPVRREILALLKDEHAKALVLRVNSPGGSALASENLWEATAEWQAAERPLVVSMGAVAASGGYYISSSADRIFAERGTLTGSIGVVGMKFVLADAFKKLGITTHRVTRGRFADTMSPTSPFTPQQQELVRKSMEEVYDVFKRRVRDGRGGNLSDELEALAGGRVYTGEQARAVGLVDEIGGLSEAVTWAAKTAGMETAPARLKPRPKSALEGLFAKPEPRPEGEIIQLGNPADPRGAALAEVLRHPATATLPAALQTSLADTLDQLGAALESSVLLIGPPLPSSVLISGR